MVARSAELPGWCGAWHTSLVAAANDGGLWSNLNELDRIRVLLGLAAILLLAGVVLLVILLLGRSTRRLVRSRPRSRPPGPDDWADRAAQRRRQSRWNESGDD